MPLWLALTSLYVGIVTGDLMIYGVGLAARRVPWLRRRFIGPEVRRIGQWLDRHLVRMVAVCKVTPGLLFPTYVACGCSGHSRCSSRSATRTAGAASPRPRCAPSSAWRSANTG